MLLVAFRSRMRPESGEDYERMAAEMLERARRAPGFVDYRFYIAEDGERLSLIWWQDEETLRAWREDERHRVAQGLGRDRWYAMYEITVAEVLRSREFRI